MTLTKNRFGMALLVVFVIAMLVFESEKIFTEVDMYYFAFSTIVQGFIALVAFLGSFVVFKIQLLENAMQLLTERVKDAVTAIRGVAAHTYSPSEMMAACGEISSAASAAVSQPIIDQTFRKMTAVARSKKDIKEVMTSFVFTASLNVSLALVCIMFSPVFAEAWVVGSVVLSGLVIFSIINLYRSWQVVQSTLGLAQESVIVQI